MQITISFIPSRPHTCFGILVALMLILSGCIQDNSALSDEQTLIDPNDLGAAGVEAAMGSSEEGSDGADGTGESAANMDQTSSATNDPDGEQVVAQSDDDNTSASQEGSSGGAPRDAAADDDTTASVDDELDPPSDPDSDTTAEETDEDLSASGTGIDDECGPLNGPDVDGDCVPDVMDNCPGIENEDQGDEDGDGIGDVCALASDLDLDEVPDDIDNCLQVPNVGQSDADEDGIGDVCDNCPLIQNPAQEDTTGDGVGNACPQRDFDNDEKPDSEDNCPDVYNLFQTDSDGDGIGDACDNCMRTPNADQTDSDGDGYGDLCDRYVPDAVVVLEWGDIAHDFDIHVIRPSSDGDDLFSRATRRDSGNDCWAGNPQNDWCYPGLWPEGFRGGSANGDAPGNGSGDPTEQIRLGTPSDRDHIVAVDFYRAANAGAAPVRVTLRCGDVNETYQTYMRFESQEMRLIWEVARFNPTDCSIEELNRFRPMACGGERFTVCQDALCSNVVCRDGTVCDEATGMCMERGEIEDQEEAPQVSEWDSFRDPPICGSDRDCTEDETCENVPGTRTSVCVADCEEENAVCPGQYACCSFFGRGKYCIPDQVRMSIGNFLQCE